MPWFAVYDVATGALKSSGSRVSPTFVEDRDLRRAAGEDVPDWGVKELTSRPVDGMGWNPATLDWDIAPQPVAHVWTAKEFVLLFKMSEWMHIQGLRPIDPIVDYFFSMTEVYDVIHSDHPSVVQGLAYLVEFSDLTPERETAILNNEVPV